MPAETTPTARALMALEILQSCPGITADQLGDRLGVSSRAARRYVAVLREADIPISSTRGPYGGYRVGRGLRLPPLQFSATEALGLVMAALDGHHQVGDPADPVGSALAKIMRALPKPVTAQAEAVRRSIAPARDRGAARPDPDVTSTLVQACGEHRRVRVDYRSEAGNEWSAEVDPWSVVVRHGRWYVLGHSHHAGAVRALRVDRIQAVEQLSDGFTPPADLDPVAQLEQHLAVGWEYDTEVVVAAPLSRVQRCVPRSLGRLEAIDGDTTRLVGSTSNPGWYAEQLTTVPADFRIVGCAELRAAVSKLGQRLLASAQDDKAQCSRTGPTGPK